jgi:Domain of unknown function (DUF4375)
MKNQEIIENYFQIASKDINQEIIEDESKWYNYIKKLPSELQIIYNIMIFHKQVMNGGIHQYFFNSYGMFSYLTLNNLETINAFKTANILNRALKIINYQNLNEEIFRNKIFNRKLEIISDFDEDVFNKLSILDDEYYELDEDLEVLYIEYLSE